MTGETVFVEIVATSEVGNHLTQWAYVQTVGFAGVLLLLSALLIVSLRSHR